MDGQTTIRAPSPSRGRSLAISPHGRLLIGVDAGTDDALSGAAADRIAKAFERGEGAGLLALATSELETALPAGFAYLRELARAFLTRLCTVSNLEERRELVEVERDDARLEELALAAPPMAGAEYLGRAVLERLWEEMQSALRAELAAHAGTVQSWLERKNPAWNLVGRVCFHLAENKRDPQAPFAFLATYAARLSAQGKAQHKPLGQALTEYAGAKNRSTLLSLLLPVQRAAQRSELVRALVDSGEIYQPLAWSPGEAYRFLKELPVLESSGVVVRIPDWWKRRPPRPEVRVTVGERPAFTLGVESLLDFKVELTLDGERIARDEWDRLLASTQGLALVKGKWVEVDREKLSAVLGHWKAAEKAAGRNGVSFLEGMRLLAGVSLAEKDDVATAERADWSRVVAGSGLRELLAELSRPDAARDADPGGALKTELRPYQRAGVAWLWRLNRLGLGGCLADDMGLGKTIQVLALLLLMKGAGGPSLLVVPASLVANWKAEAGRFAPDLRVLVAHPSERPSEELARLGPDALDGIDVVVTTYGSVGRFAWLAKTRWDLVVLDEAQAIKNPGAKQTRAIKALEARARIALTGTPVENRLSDLWSIFDFLCPGLLGSAAEFGRFSKRLAASDAPSRYAPLRELVRPYILRRLKTDRTVISDLPEKTEVRAFCSLSKKQAALYEETVAALARELDAKDGIERRGAVLAYLLRLKQICNHPSQWLGDGAFEPDDSGKLARLRELAEPIAARQEKVLVFTQFREMTGPLARFLESVFGRPGLVLHGETKVKDRRALVESFQDERGPPFFVLSLKAGGTGLNLTAASHVIHFDRWWNPAVENQATDRAFRIGQKKNVLVHKFVCRGTVEEKVDALIESKRELASSVVGGGGEVLLTELPNEEILRLVSLDIHAALAEA